MAVVLWIILAVAVILFIVSVALGAKVWRVPTLLTVIGLFFAGLAFFVLAACVLQSHKHWRDVARTLESDLKKEQQRRAQLVGGVWGDDEDLTAQMSGESAETAPPADAPVDATETPPADAPATDQPTDTPTDATPKDEEAAKQPEAKTDEAAPEATPKEPENKEAPKTEPSGEEKTPEEKAPEKTEETKPDEEVKPAEEAEPEESAENLATPARFNTAFAPQDEEPKADEAQPKADETKPDEAKPEEAKPDEATPAEAKPDEAAEKKEDQAKPDAEAAEQPKEEMPQEPPAETPAGETPATADAAEGETPGDTSPAPPGPAMRRMGIEQLKQQVRQLREDRGRIWEGQGKLAGNGATVTVTLPDPHNLTPNTILYVFEKKDQGLFLGEFKVTQVADKTVTLESAVALTEDEKKRFAGRDGDWLLSDKPPVDSHEALAGLSRDQLMKLLPPKSADYFVNPEAQHPALIAEFENDLKTAKEAGIKADDSMDPRAKRVFARVEVLEEFETPKPPDAPAAPAAEGAEPPRAQPGSTMLLDREEAAKLAKENKVKIVEEVYVRPLRRYELYWHAAHDRRLALEDRINQLAGQTAAMKAADASAQEVKKQREKEKSELESDQKKLAADRDVAKKHLDELNQAEQGLRTAIKDAFVKNRDLAAQLTRAQTNPAQKAKTKPAAAQATAR